jgi:hypothetical protein
MTDVNCMGVSAAEPVRLGVGTNPARVRDDATRPLKTAELGLMSNTLLVYRKVNSLGIYIPLTT